MKKSLIGYSRSLTAITCLALGVALHFTALSGLAGPGGKKGKPSDDGGGGGSGDGGGNSAPVEYQLTWIPGINDGRMDIFDCNTAGFAVGGYTDETGTNAPFCTTADGLIRPLKDWWVLPTGYEGWRVGGTEMQINEANLVCGTIGNDQTSEYQLFQANLSDPHSLEVVGSVQKYSLYWVFMNEHGDVTWRSVVEGNITTLHLYVRSLARGYDLSLMSVNDAGDLPTTGISLVIAALVGGDLHIRIFDADGDQVIDKPEAELANRQELSDLKDFLEGIPFPDEPTMSAEEVTTIIEEAASVSGHPLDKSFSLDTGERSYYPTGINDNLQISLVRHDRTGDYYMSPSFSGSGLLTFDVATEIAYIEPLGDYAYSWADPLLLPWGGLNNAGDVFGCFETKVSRTRYRNLRLVSRVADTTAGFIAADSATWSELDPRLPVGGAQANAFGFAAAACALDVNESGQVVGGYQCSGRFSNGEDLWLLDPVDGLFDVKGLVVGDPAEVEAFQAANEFKLVQLTEEIDPETGYGIITGASSYSGPVFILTPHRIEQP